MSREFDTSRIQEHHLYDGLEEAPCLGEELLLQGPAGNIEISTSYPPFPAKNFAVVVICHPHPLYGGSMANKVVHTLSAVFNGMGMPTLRFNFRGVGRSEGEYDRCTTRDAVRFRFVVAGKSPLAGDPGGTR